jgi:hypothetical protein
MNISPEKTLLKKEISEVLHERALLKKEISEAMYWIRGIQIPILRNGREIESALVD